MKVVVLSPVFPFPLDSGLKIRVFGLLKALAESHEVALLCFCRQGEGLQIPDTLSRLCRKIVTIPIQSCLRYQTPTTSSRMRSLWRALFQSEPMMIRGWRSPAMEEALRALLLERYDVVWISRLWLGGMVSEIAVPTVLDLDDLESEKQRRTLRTMPWKLSRVVGYAEVLKLAGFEHQAVTRFGAVVVTSKKDREALQAGNVFVLPNTIALPTTPMIRDDRENDDDLIFFGLMRYRPNIDGVDYFCSSIWPRIKSVRPAARLWIVGAHPTPSVLQYHDGKSIIVTGYVEDLRSMLGRCSVVIVPLRIGGGTRIKILEAMAAGKAVVSTEIGCEGLDVQHRKHLLIADQPEEFSRCCLDLMADRVQREVLGKNGRRLIEERYRWELVPDMVNRILDAVRSS